MHSGIFNGASECTCALFESNPVFLGYCKRRCKFSWILKLCFLKTFISDSYSTLCLCFVNLNPLSLKSVISCLQTFRSTAHITFWRSDMLEALLCISSEYYRLKVLCSWPWFPLPLHFVLISVFHTVTISVNPVTSPCLRFVGDIVSSGAFSRLSRTLLYQW